MAKGKEASARNQRRAAAKRLENTINAHPCGECIACCQTHQFEGLKKPVGVLCEHVGKKGCTQYARRPQGCRDYFCAYRFGVLGDDLRYRPDALSIVFDVLEDAPDGLFFLQAREVVPGAIDDHMAELHEIAAKGAVLRLVELDRVRIMGAEEKVKAIQNWEKRHLPLLAQ